MLHERVHCRDEAADHQLPIAAAFWIIWVVSTEEWTSLKQHLMQICCSTHSVLLNVMATQYTYSLQGIYCPYWLVWWSCHCSCMCIPVHSPWLPGYINVTQIVLVMLTMTGLFMDKPCTSGLFSYQCLCPPSTLQCRSLSAFGYYLLHLSIMHSAKVYLRCRTKMRIWTLFGHIGVVPIDYPSIVL